MDSPLGAADPAAEPRRLELQSLLRREIPIAAPMDVAVDRIAPQGLWLSMPLAPNRNPHQTAFAGSLNSLCTMAGWAMTHLLLEQLGIDGATVLRRSSIKYHEPVESPRVVAWCLPPRDADWEHFVEMLPEKGQAKLDLVVEIAGTVSDRPAVLFAGNYVVLGNGEHEAAI
jgi:thioesterase domain-containing protein